MPTTYTHYCFGKDVLELLPQDYKDLVNKYRQLYDIGLHGPDLLFYYKPMSSNEVSATGYAMHECPGRDFFSKGKELVQKSDNPDALKAYLFGFICHFALDSTCHPYVEKIDHSSSMDHSMIEAELDRFFMMKDQINPNRRAPVKHIKPTAFNSSVIAECFEDISEKEVLGALKGMVSSLKLLHAPDPIKRNVLYAGLKIAGKYDSMQGLIMKPRPIPEFRRYWKTLRKKYLEAIPVAVDLITNYGNVLDKDELLSSRFDLTFGAGDNWETLEI